MTLAADGVSFTYAAGAARAAVHRASIELRPGELTVVGGPNGSGKSTLARLLAGLISPDEGTVSLDGTSISDWPRSRIANRLGALPQREETVFPMRVRDAVLLGLWSKLGPFAAAGDHEIGAVERAMDRCDLLPFSDRMTDTLSGGEWQRVRIARALVSEPDFLLLDEPGTALDLAHEMSLFQLLTELTSLGIGIMVITHHLNPALRHADRVVLMSEGRIVRNGVPGEVIDTEAVTETFGWPIDVNPGPDGAPQLYPRRPGAAG